MIMLMINALVMRLGQMVFMCQESWSSLMICYLQCCYFETEPGFWTGKTLWSLEAQITAGPGPELLLDELTAVVCTKIHRIL